MDEEPRENLEAEGWQERFTASGSRLEEAAAYYRSLGYEVRIEGIEAAESGTCASCFLGPSAEGPVGVIFTRVGSAPRLEEEEELFEE